MAADAKVKKDIELLKFKRDSLFQRIDYLYIRAQTLSVDADADQISEFKVRCEKLAAHYEGFERYQSELVKCYVQLKETEEISALQEKNQEVDSRYFKILSVKNTLLPALGLPKKEATGDSPNLPNAKLPKINLPIFDGTLKEWPHFKDLFTALVHTNESLSLIEKFHHLLSCTKNEPNVLVRSMPLCSNNYELVWAQLNERYDNKRLLASQYIEDILTLQPINYESPKLLRNMLDLLNENAMALKSMEMPDDLGNFIILHVTLKKLDKHTRQLFERKFSEKEYPKLNDLLEFLRDHCKSLDAAQGLPTLHFTPATSKVNDYRPNCKSNKSFKVDRPLAHKSFHAKTDTSPQTCIYCAQDHTIYTCPAFQNLNPSSRRDFVKSKEACFNCLSPSHMLSKCNSTHSCRKCYKRHHTTLHEDRPSSQQPEKPNTSRPASQQLCRESSTTSSSTAPNNYSHHSSSPQQHSTTLLGTALVQIADSANTFQTFRALIDPGSQSSFITESSVKRLSLPRSRLHQNVLGLSQTAVSATKGQVSCVLKPVHADEPLIPTSAVILNTITSNLPSTRLNQSIIQYFKNWQLADPHYYEPSSVDILIGANLFPLIFNGGRASSPPGFPAPFETIFGWILIGEVNLLNFETTTPDPLLANLAVNECSLDKSLKQFWEIEEVPYTKQISPANEVCEKMFIEGHSRDETGRYIVKLPFKEKSPDLGNSFELAKTNFLYLERRFAHNTQLKAAYSEFMTDYERLGHMTRLDSTFEPKPLYVIPHHGVFKASEVNSKIRVVFNASAQTSNGISLNDTLHVGEKLQNDVCDILFRFRLHPYVIMADICKMYRQILIHHDDRPFQTILWRSSPQSTLQLFSLNTVTYGVSCSPYLAIRTLQQLVYDEGANFPMASNAILYDTFVDDCITGCATLEDLHELKSQLIQLLQKGGFELSKWASNVPTLLSDVQAQNSDILFKSNSEENQPINVLGLKWNQGSDSFLYNVPAMQIVNTKRGILSNISRLFDPLGLITPIILWAKCLMQNLWAMGLDWDQLLPDHLINQSGKFFEELSVLSQLRISRLVVPPDSSAVQLHGFSDGSERGYGCAIYIRSTCNDGSVVTNLVMAKSKVAPLKRLSIPKLELCGAYLLAKTMKFCQLALSEKCKDIPIFAWTDSTVVLYWIRSSPHLLKTFVANRVADLQSSIDPARWRHTPTHTNPADPASRGLLPHQIIHHPLWWNGPDWLREEETSWPSQHIPDSTPEESLTELRTNHSTGLVSVKHPPLEDNPLLEKFSTFGKLQSCLGWVLRFINNCRKDKKKTTASFLLVSERKLALYTLVRLTQQQYFTNQIQLISEKKPCASFLQRLNPFLDENGILRVGGRLRNSSLPYDHKHPMLLPKHSTLTKLLISHFHSKYLHAGPRTTQSLLSREFWIISARQIIRHCLSKCLTCHKFNAKSAHPPMGNLPDSRLSSVRSFLKVGVDFGGPYLTKSDKLRKPQTLKSYICLFVCMSTKAVHLEMVSSLSTDAFLAALNRFVSRRGIPTDIYSDQGTNFVGAGRELNDLHNLLRNPKDTQKILTTAAEKGITWHFNPPSAPHFGGLWEAGIKSTKYHIKRLLGTQTLTFEEFTTLLAQIEAILNSRPLCNLSSDANEFETLTPGHFLIGEPLVAIPQPDFTSLPSNRLSRWQLVQQISRHFWKRWSQEYLHHLQQRQKWFSPQPNLVVDELVLIKDTNLPPMAWKLGRIVNTHPGADGIVRVVTLRTPQGTFKRPVNKLCPLPVEEH